MLEIYLIRHGESESNLNNIVGGKSLSSGLSERGFKQAEALGKRFAREGVYFTDVYSSTAKRAIQTAEEVKKSGVFALEKIVLQQELLERSGGDWEGRLRVEVFTPEIIKQITKHIYDWRAPNGESRRNVEHRMYDWVEKNVLIH